MAPALPAGLIGREAAACVLLGVVLGGARALFPEKGRGAFLPDVLLVGALLLGLQSYAASLSFGGVLRWYQLAAAVFGAWAAERVLLARKARSKRAKERRNAKWNAKKQKKNLPRPPRMLYNSNVSK